MENKVDTDNIFIDKSKTYIKEYIPSNKELYNKMIIINKINIKKIIEEMNKYKKCVIFGKGPTFVKKIKEEDELYICINHTINEIDGCDILVCNDIETFDKIEKQKLKQVKYLIVPAHPHYNSKFNKDITLEQILNNIKDYYQGNIIPYNLLTSNYIYDNFIIIQSMITSSNTAFEFITTLTNIKLIDLYGIGVYNENNQDDYNEVFGKLRSSIYTKQYISLIRKHIINLSIKYNIKLNIN